MQDVSLFQLFSIVINPSGTPGSSSPSMTSVFVVSAPAPVLSVLSVAVCTITAISAQDTVPHSSSMSAATFRLHLMSNNLTYFFKEPPVHNYFSHPPPIYGSSSTCNLWRYFCHTVCYCCPFLFIV